MKSLVLIPWARTDWSDEGRISARTALTLNDAGCEQAHAWGKELVDAKVALIFVADQKTAKETAETVAAETDAKVKVLDELEEVGVGLWEGLTALGLKARYERVYKRWLADPASVCPPSGEPLSAALERLDVPLRKVMKKTAKQTVALVLGPMALAVVRCRLESVNLTSAREMMSDHPVRYGTDQLEKVTFAERESAGVR